MTDHPKAPNLPDWALRFSAKEDGAAATSLKDEILAISGRCAALPDFDLRSTAEILGYDERGLPK
jgi:antitoxin VapB